jgi:serine/threonine-protein kinase
LAAGTLEDARAADARIHLLRCAACEELVAEVTRSLREGTVDETLPAVLAESWSEGTVVADRFEILAPLGRGGMGIVLLARDRVLDREVALKILHRSPVEDRELRLRFEREARAMARIASPHVASVLDVGVSRDGRAFLVMERLVGVDLQTRLAERGPADVAEVVSWLRQACLALAEAHRRSIVHRDLKPANLFLAETTEGVRIKILDFGISKHDLGEATALTASRALVGTPIYMSPEQACAAKGVDGRSDLWSLGVIGYELLTGIAPFRRDSLAATLAAILKEEPPELRSLRPDVPADLAAILRRCVAKDPEARPATAEELEHALAQAGRASPRPDRRRPIFAVGFAICVVVGALSTPAILAARPGAMREAEPVSASPEAVVEGPSDPPTSEPSTSQHALPLASIAPVVAAPSTTIVAPRVVAAPAPSPSAAIAASASTIGVVSPPAPIDPNPEFGGRK